MRHTLLAEPGALLRSAGGREDLRAEIPGDLHGGLSGAARRRMNEHALTGTEPGHVDEALPRRHQHNG